LDSLVEQELAAQAARAAGLDHDPDVVQALQLAQREVLAKAYQDRLATKARGSTSDEVDRYYDTHPELFEQRRLYVIQETAVEAAPAESDAIGALVQGASGAGEVADRLRARSLRFETRQFVQAAESLPLGLLLPMAQLAQGQSIVMPQPDGVRIFTVLHVQLAPVDRRRAAEPIAAFLNAERRRRLVVDGMEDLRKAASVEYLGNFAASEASVPASKQHTTN
jgi:EpsD family peptidyl-prolyl cis-trans isomerase